MLEKNRTLFSVCLIPAAMSIIKKTTVYLVTVSKCSNFLSSAMISARHQHYKIQHHEYGSLRWLFHKVWIYLQPIDKINWSVATGALKFDQHINQCLRKAWQNRNPCHSTVTGIRVLGSSKVTRFNGLKGARMLISLYRFLSSGMNQLSKCMAD